MPRLLRVTTVPISLTILLHGQLRFFMDQGFEVLAVSADGRETEDLKREGIAHSVVPMTREITPFRDLVSLWRMIRIIKKFKPDIVHTHTPKAGIIGQLAAWLCGIQVRMHTVAGLPLMEAKGFRKSLLLWVERVTYACATNVYPNSKGLEEYIKENISTETPVKIIGNGSSNGIDITHFRRSATLEEKAVSLRSERGFMENDIVFSFAGRIVKDKGISEVITAFRRLTRKVSGQRYRLLLIGSFEQELDPLSAEDHEYLTSASEVTLAGFQPDVRPWIMASDIFVFPSYREGFPNVVMQACCLGIPCIVSDINGCNEIISHGTTGLIVPPRNAGALYDAMLQLAEDSTARKQLASQAGKFIAQNFSQQAVWSELLKEYRFLLKARER